MNQEQKLCRFAEFWALYPRKDAKAKAQSIWTGKKLDGYTEQIMADLQARLDDGQWTELRFVPHATTYLNQRRWEDEWAGAESRFQQLGHKNHPRNFTSKAGKAIYALELLRQKAGGQMSTPEHVEANCFEGEFTALERIGGGRST